MSGRFPRRLREARGKFADTFAKWALRGDVSAAGAGYGIPAPASLEDWGAPLAAIAVQLDTAARQSVP